MHLHVIICFAVLIWWPREPPFGAAINSPEWVWATVWLQVPVFLAAAALTSAAARRRLDGGITQASQAQEFCHRATFLLRLACVLGFLGAVFFTDWVQLVRSMGPLSVVPGAADLVVLMPFLVACIAVFAGLFPIDRAIHQAILDARVYEGHTATLRVWNRWQYLNFNLRHHLLVVVVPMTLVLMAFDLARAQEEALVGMLGFPWAAEAAPGFAAGVVFIFAPLLLRRIWTTRPLPDGPLRRELQGICDRIGLPCRDILIWQSGGMMVNAAVMGLFRRVRYVMLSDGLLEAMSRRQIKAVFGHEAGHVRHRHIQFFLLFAVCSMLLLSALIEALRLGVERGLFELDALTIQGIGPVVALGVWGLGFGWISRRFERQADVFGAYCITPEARNGCRLPCSVHADGPDDNPPPSAVCATAAEVFVSALNRVALLNGIPQEEWSWRHSSIASRVRFLTSLSGDPRRARRFERLIRRIKRALLVVAVGGSMVAGLYVWHHPIYGVGAVAGTDQAAGNTTVRPAAAASPKGTVDARPDH